MLSGDQLSHLHGGYHPPMARDVFWIIDARPIYVLHSPDRYEIIATR